MRIAVAAVALLMAAACQDNGRQIVADVCKPINEEGGASLEKLAAAKHYDVEEVRRVCRRYLKDQVEETERQMREMGAIRSGPLDAN